MALTRALLLVLAIFLFSLGTVVAQDDAAQAEADAVENVAASNDEAEEAEQGLHGRKLLAASTPPKPRAFQLRELGTLAELLRREGGA